MNFIAHLELSYPNHQEMVGNFIGDYVKGKQYENFPEVISSGILLHRKIDTYTDAHEIHKNCRDMFRPFYGLYSGVVVDMLFDHLLALHWHHFQSIDYFEFCELSYQVMFDEFDFIPARVQDIIPKMKKAQRFESYARKQGLEKALHLMSVHTSLPDETSEAMKIIDSNDEILNRQFILFYQSLHDEIIHMR